MIPVSYFRRSGQGKVRLTVQIRFDIIPCARVEEASVQRNEASILVPMLSCKGPLSNPTGSNVGDPEQVHTSTEALSVLTGMAVSGTRGALRPAFCHLVAISLQKFDLHI